MKKGATRKVHNKYMDGEIEFFIVKYKLFSVASPGNAYSLEKKVS